MHHSVEFTVQSGDCRLGSHSGTPSLAHWVITLTRAGLDGQIVLHAVQCPVSVRRRRQPESILSACARASASCIMKQTAAASCQWRGPAAGSSLSSTAQELLLASLSPDNSPLHQLGLAPHSSARPPLLPPMNGMNCDTHSWPGRVSCGQHSPRHRANLLQ